MLHEKGMQTDPVLISPVFHPYSHQSCIIQDLNRSYNPTNRLMSSFSVCTSPTDFVPNIHHDLKVDQYNRRKYDQFACVRKLETRKISRHGMEKIVRKTRQRLFQLIKKSGMDLSNLIGKFAAKVELVHPCTFDGTRIIKKSEFGLLPTPPFSPTNLCPDSTGIKNIWSKGNHGNCSEGAQLLLFLKGSD